MPIWIVYVIAVLLVSSMIGCLLGLCKCVNRNILKTQITLSLKCITCLTCWFIFSYQHLPISYLIILSLAICVHVLFLSGTWHLASQHSNLISRTTHTFWAEFHLRSVYQNHPFVWISPLFPVLISFALFWKLFDRSKGFKKDIC